MNRIHNYIACLVICLVSVSFLHAQGKKETTYSGKTLRQWFQIFKTAPNSAEKRDALRAISKFGVQAIPVLETVLTNFDPVFADYREMAASHLADIGLPAVPVLLKAKKHMYGTVRAAAEDSLHDFTEKSKRSITKVANLYTDDIRKPYSILQVCVRLLSAGDVHPLVIKLATETSVKGRIKHMKALSTIGPDSVQAVPVLVLMLNDSNKKIRLRSVKTLGRMNHSVVKAVPALIAVVKNRQEKKTVRIVFLNTLGSIGKDSDDVVPFLIQTLGDRNKRVRRKAIQVLGKLGPSAVDAVPVLKILSKIDPAAANRKVADEAVKKIEGKNS